MTDTAQGNHKGCPYVVKWTLETPSQTVCDIASTPCADSTVPSPAVLAGTRGRPHLQGNHKGCPYVGRWDFADRSDMTGRRASSMRAAETKSSVDELRTSRV